MTFEPFCTLCEAFGRKVKAVTFDPWSNCFLCEECSSGPVADADNVLIRSRRWGILVPRGPELPELAKR